MSTRINVNIGDGGLLDRNAQQQAAARQANQQRASADKAAAEGQRQLEAVRISQGRDPLTGERLPSAGSSSRIQRINQEPAANRRSGLPNFILAPPFNPVGTSHFGKSKGTGSLTRNEWFLAFTEIEGNFPPPSGSPPTLFTVSPGGPNNQNYLRFAPANINIISLPGGSQQFSIDEPGVSSSELGTSITQNNTRDNAFAASLISNSPRLPLSPPTLYDLNKLKGYTVEFYLKRPTVTLGDFTLIPDPNFLLTTFFTATSRVSVFLEAASPSNLFPPIRDFIEVTHTITGSRTYLQPGVTTQTTSMAISYLNRSTAYFEWTDVEGDFTYTFDEWQHFAVCIDSNTAKFYIGGQLASTRAHAFADIMQQYADAVREAGDTNGQLTLRARTGARISTTGGETGVQGFRFTPRVLYTGSFTPPVIQTFA
jgi:hypothetical protein